MLCLCSSVTVWAPIAYAGETFNIRVPEQSVRDAIKSLSYQTQHSVLFKSDDLEDAKTKSITGRYSLEEALKRMLAYTDLKGGLTESGVIVISLRKGTSVPSSEGTTMVTKEIKQTLLTGAAAISIAGVATQSPAHAQTPPTQPEIIRPASISVENINDEIIVTGRRINQELAITAKRDAKKIIDLLSANQAGRLPDNNVAESLSRIPGVTVQRNGDTGNGDFISIRGLDSALNNVQFNGINSGLSNNSGDRRVPLDGISAEDISEIRVSKTLLPQDEGEGIGGAINVISKSPLERGKDQFRFNTEGRYSEFADKLGYKVGGGFTKIFNEDFGVSLSVTKRKRFIENIEINGISSNPLRLPVVRDVAGNVIEVDDIIDGGGVFNQPGDSYDNVPAGFFDVEDIGFENQEYELGNQERDTLSISGAADWQVSNSTRLTLGGFLSKQESESSEYVFAFDVDEEDFVNINGVATTFFNDAEIDFEARQETGDELNANLYLRGVSELGRLNLKYQASYATASENEPRVDFNFSSRNTISEEDINGDDIQVFTPFSLRDTYFPVPNAGFLAIPGAIEAITDLEGTQEVSRYNQDYVDEQTNDRYALKFDGDYELKNGLFGGLGSRVQFGAKVERSDIRLDFRATDTDEGFLNLDGSYEPTGDGTADGAALGEFDLFGGLDTRALRNIGNPLTNIGTAPGSTTPLSILGLPTLDDALFRAFNDRNLAGFLASGDAPDENTFFDVREDVYAAYAQAELEWDNLTVIGGLRIEHYEGTFTAPIEVESEFLTEDEDFDLIANSTGGVITSESSNTEVLPRITATYRLSDTIQFRAGLGYSIARPTFSQLGSPVEITVIVEANDGFAPGVEEIDDLVALGVATSDVQETAIFIESGNPDLENSKSTNIDFSAEYYPNPSTLFSAGIFYKEIDDFIFIGQETGEGGESASIVPAALASVTAGLSSEGMEIINQLGGLEALAAASDGFNFFQPNNGGTAEIYGIEFGVSHAFDWAPGIFADMGFTGNITFTESEATYDVAELDDGQDAAVPLGFFEDGDILTRTTSFFAAPDISGNASIYYEANGLEIAVSGSYQSSAFNASDDYGLDQFNVPYFQADLFMGYKLPIKSGNYTVFLEVADFTDDGTKGTDVQSVGRNSELFDEASFNGREVVFGLRGRF